MLYREIIAVCSQIHTEHTNTLCGQDVEYVSVKLVVHIVTAGLRIIQHVLPLHVTHTKQKAVCLQSLHHSSNAGYFLSPTSVSMSHCFPIPASLTCNTTQGFLRNSVVYRHVPLKIGMCHGKSVRSCDRLL